MSVVGDLSAYSFVQAKKDFEDARQDSVPDGWEAYVDSSNKSDTIKIWRKHDPAVRPTAYSLINHSITSNSTRVSAIEGDVDSKEACFCG